MEQVQATNFPASLFSRTERLSFAEETSAKLREVMDLCDLD